MPDETPQSTSPSDSSRFSELLALGEASLRKLADNARQLQDVIGGGPVARGVNPEAAENRAVAEEALSKLKNGIYQMRNLFAEARKTGGVPLTTLHKCRKCLKRKRAEGEPLINVQKYQNNLKTSVERAKNIAIKAYPPVREAVTTSLERSEAYVKESPVKGLLACLGVGLLLGVIIGR